MSAPNQPYDFDLKKVITPSRMRGLWRLMSGFRMHYIGATLFVGLAATAKTGTFLLLRYFVDSFLTQGTSAFPLPAIALGFVGLALIEGSFTFLSGRLAAQTAEGVTRRLRNYLFDHIQRLTFAYHSQIQTGDLIQRSTSDVDAIRRFFSDQAIGVGRIVLLFTINFIAILNLNVRLGLISVIVIPLVLAVSIFFFKKITTAYEKYQEQDSVLTTTLQENLSGVRVVKAFARQEYEISKFEKQNWEKFRRGSRLLRIHSLFWPTSDILCSAQLLTGFYIGAMMAINGEISVGTYLAYAGLIVWIIFPIRNLGRLVVQTSTGLVSLGRVLDIIKQDREPLEDGDYRPDRMSGGLEFRKVGFSYAADQEVLHDISFTCQPGQVIALLGSTGSGKTTLVNLLPRFFDSSTGEILLDGVDLKRYPRSYLRRHIGIVEQEPFLFSRSIRENIMYGAGKQARMEDIEAAAQAAQAHEFILSFKDGYDTIVGEKGVTVSGGQKQRIAIARTLLKNPRILIMDDSTSAVDTETEAEIRLALHRLMQNRTTFIIAHRIQSIMDADLILVMEGGRIIQMGRHDDLLARDGVYRQIFDIQTRIEDELEQEIASA